MIKVMEFIFIFFIFLQTIRFGSSDVITIPPFKTNKETILKILSLENITIDVPALFVFGDSFVDAGNNIYYNAKEEHRNFTPYGIDFDGKSTGRYTNGRTVTDFIAQIAGLPFPPPVLSFPNRSKQIPKTGLNYASGFTGLLDIRTLRTLFPDMDPPLENPIQSLMDQVDMFENTTKELRRQFESQESFSAYMSKALFFINSGSYEMDTGWQTWRLTYHEEQLTKLLISKLSANLRRLYQLGARKIVINNVSPIGCEPYQGFVCDEKANDRALLFNKRLSNLLKDLQSILKGSKFILIDLYKIFEDVYKSPTSYGFVDVKGTCCDLDEGEEGPCAANAAPCEDRNSYVFFDAYNPTENMHFIWTRRMLKDSSVSYPFNLVHLIQS